MTFIKQHAAPIIFAVAYAAFMGVSIPKVGAMFLLYSEQHGGSGLVWAIASYGAAVTIDALIGFLTYATTSKRRDWYMQAGIWLFVLILSVYSVYFNWVYDELHSPYANARLVWSLPSPLPGWDVQQLTTLLISAVPLGILGFTLIARIIREEKHTVSLEDLRQAAADAKERATLQQEIDTAKVGRGTSWARKRIQAGKEMLSELAPSKKEPDQNGQPVQAQTSQSEELPEKLQKTLAFLASTPGGTDEELADYLGLLRPASARFWRLKAMEITGDNKVFSSLSNGSNPPDVVPSQEEVIRPWNEEQSDQVAPSDQEVFIPSNSEQPSQVEASNPPEVTSSCDQEHTPGDDALQEMFSQFPLMTSIVSGSAKSVHVQEVIRATGLSEKRVRNRIANGVLKRTPNNPNLVLKTSLIDWWKKSWEDEVNRQQSAKLRVVKLTSNEGQNGHHAGASIGQENAS